MMEVLACIVALTVAGNPNVEHPRLYFSKADLPHLQSKSKGTHEIPCVGLECQPAQCIAAICW